MSDLFTDEELPLDPEKDYLEDLVGDGKKFKTPAELARGKLESDRYVNRLEGELKGLREELSKRLTLEEAVEKISTRTQPKSPEAPAEGTNNQLSDKQPDLETLVAEKVKETLKSLSTQSQADTNYAEVQRVLQEKYGANYKAAAAAKAKELGLGIQFLDNLAKEQPKAFLHLMGVDQKTPANVTVPAGDVVSETFNDSRRFAGEKKNSYYEEIRKKDPRTYWTPKMQNEIHNQALKLGPNFFDT